MTQELTTRKFLPFLELSVLAYFSAVTSVQDREYVREKT